jgi:hypothetical protein
MQRLEVSGAVRPLKWPLGVKWLSVQTEYIAVVVEGSSEFGSIPASYVGDPGFKQYL